MKCRHCRKEILNENANYCEHCGESLIKEDLLNVNIDTSSHDQVNAEQIRVAKETVKKNKVAIIIAAVVLLAVIAGISVFSYIKGRPLNESKVEKAVMGQTISVGAKEIKLSDKTIETIKIKSRKTEKKSTDDVTLNIKVKVNKEFTAELEYIASFSYDKGWKFQSGYVKEVEEINAKGDISDKIIKELKKQDQIYTSDYESIPGYLIKEIDDMKCKKDDDGYSFSGKVVLTNGLYYTEGKIKGNAYIDTYDFNFSVGTANITDLETAKKEKKEDKDLTLEVIKNYAFSDYHNSYKYTYKIDDRDYSEEYEIYDDDITELKINNTTEKTDDNLLRIEVEGKAKNEDIKNLEFTGVVNIPLKIGEEADTDSEIEITKVEAKEIKEDFIKDELLDMDFDGKSIKKAVAESFKETSRDNKYIGEKYIDGTVKIDGTEVKMQVQCQLKATEDDDYNVVYKWEVVRICKEDSFLYNKYQ